MRILFRPRTRSEVLEAQAWYESRATGLGLEFARALDAAVASAMRNPEAFALIASSCRQVLLRRFPFSLVYRVRGDELLIVAVSITDVTLPNSSYALGANNSFKPSPHRYGFFLMHHWGGPA